MRPIYIVRAQPGANATAMRARAAGLDARVAPMFAVQPVPWAAPDAASFDAVLFTSANGVRAVGAPWVDRPCWCVGPATMAAAQSAGWRVARTGHAGGDALLAGADGAAALLWL
ncbi:MAG: uroporphyrinogen-III synthase, partial [Sphingopyxis sp.]